MNPDLRCSASPDGQHHYGAENWCLVCAICGDFMPILVSGYYPLLADVRAELAKRRDDTGAKQG